MARPKKPISERQVEELAGINCSYEEMAAVLDCDEKTLSNRFSQAIKKGRARMRTSLKRKQYDVAMQGNVGMLIWLGKQHLDQSDKRDVDLSAKVEHASSFEVQALEEIKELFKNSIKERKSV